MIFNLFPEDRIIYGYFLVVKAESELPCLDLDSGFGDTEDCTTVSLANREVATEDGDPGELRGRGGPGPGLAGRGGSDRHASLFC